MNFKSSNPLSKAVMEYIVAQTKGTVTMTIINDEPIKKWVTLAQKKYEKLINFLGIKLTLVDLILNIKVISKITATINKNTIVKSGFPILENPIVEVIIINPKIIPFLKSIFLISFFDPDGHLKIKYEVIITNGIFIRNTHSHEAKFVIIPPQKGPITPPASALPPTKPNAMGGLN